MRFKLLFVCSSFLFLSFASNECGKYRWDYKILIDPDGLALFRAQSKTSSINELVQIQRPSKEELRNHRTQAENQKVTVSAVIIAYGTEDDGDYHLVLKSPSSRKTLIGEIPDPSCDRLIGFPGLQNLYTKARNFIDAKLGHPPSSVKDIAPNSQIKVTVTGVPLFDIIAHGNGHADNGIEIHPILKIR